MNQQQQQLQQQQQKEQIPKQIKTKVPKGMVSFQCAGTQFIVYDKYEYIK